MKCKICGKEFKSIGTHIQYAHQNISYKEYYDAFLRKEDEGICRVCGKETVFLGITRGYTQYCSTQCKYKRGELLSHNTKLVEEWDYDANFPYTPDDYSIRSNKSVWWVCSKGHKWQASIANRVGGLNKKGRGCPYCSNKKILVGFNDLATTHPNLLNEWDYEKNEDLLPTMVVAGSNQKVWWKCRYGHTWKTDVSHRALGGRNCPKCANNHTSVAEHGIAFYLKQVCEIIPLHKINKREIDVYLPQYKIGIEYDGVYFHKDNTAKDIAKTKKLISDGVQVIRIIETEANNDGKSIDTHNGFACINYKPDSMGKRYETALKTLLHYLSCLTDNKAFEQVDVNVERDRLRIREDCDITIKDNSLAVKCPQIAKEWDYEKNGNLTPEMFLYKARERVWWKCDKGHGWSATICDRSSDNTQCPYCANKKVMTGFNDLATLNPTLASEWNYDKNNGLTNKNGEDISTPTRVTPFSNQKVWWKCAICGYEWVSTINNRSNGQGCYMCNRIYGRYKRVQNTDHQGSKPRVRYM